jgi:hypothetical protein
MSVTPYESDREAIQKSVDFTVDLVKQQIVSAIFLIGFSLAFARTELSDGISFLKIAVFFLMVSFICGIFCVSIIATRVGRNIDSNPSSIPSVKFFGILQGISFIVGVLLIGLFVVLL